jgi:hypothetical protein
MNNRITSRLASRRQERRGRREFRHALDVATPTMRAELLNIARRQDFRI